ncbi:MAG: nucleotide exchange factor GrpE [Pyrinomonadaceae bacterium]
MNPEKESTENQIDEFAYDGSSSLDDFIKELEAKEKDLEISSDLVLEVEDSDLSEAETLDLLRFLDRCEEKVGAAGKTTSGISANGSPSFNEKGSKKENEVDGLRQKLSKLETERLEIHESARRQKNDFENYRKRTERERSEMFRNVLNRVANQLLPVIDNLGRALDSTVSDEKSQEFQLFRDGIGLVNQQLNEVLEEMGIQPIKSVGEPFDPNLHEAVAAEQTNKFPPHTVIAELLRGYRLDDKIIRHSLVKVSTTANSEAALTDAGAE